MMLYEGSNGYIVVIAGDSSVGYTSLMVVFTGDGVLDDGVYGETSCLLLNHKSSALKDYGWHWGCLKGET